MSGRKPGGAVLICSLFTQYLIHERHSSLYRTVHSNAVYLWNEQIVCLHTLEHTPHSHMRVLMHTHAWVVAQEEWQALAKCQLGEPTVILTLRHWEPHGSVHQVAANIKEHWECPRTGTKVIVTLRSCDARE